MHYMDADQRYEEKTWRQLHKNAMSCIEQHPSKQPLCRQLLPISKTIQIRWARHAGHCWRSKGELISDILQWASLYRWASVGRSARSYLQQLCTDLGCSLEDLPRVMDDRVEWRERLREICASGTPWWWWHIHLYTFMWVCIFFVGSIVGNCKSKRVSLSQNGFWAGLKLKISTM